MRGRHIRKRLLTLQKMFAAKTTIRVYEHNEILISELSIELWEAHHFL